MSLWSFFGAIAVGVVAFLFFSGFVGTWRRYRGRRLITCPETLQPAAVKVDALHAANWVALLRDEDLRLAACSRWPEKAGCDQACLHQIEAAPEANLLYSIVAAWYAGKSCAECRRPIGPVVWHERPPALLAPDGTTREWKEVAAEELPALFHTHQPLCWSCHIVGSFRREHPEMVVERPERPAPVETLFYTTNVY